MSINCRLQQEQNYLSDNQGRPQTSDLSKWTKFNHVHKMRHWFIQFQGISLIEMAAQSFTSILNTLFGEHKHRGRGAGINSTSENNPKALLLLFTMNHHLLVKFYTPWYGPTTKSKEIIRCKSKTKRTRLSDNDMPFLEHSKDAIDSAAEMWKIV